MVVTWQNVKRLKYVNAFAYNIPETISSLLCLTDYSSSLLLKTSETEIRLSLRTTEKFQRICPPARRRKLGCRLLFWRCPSHFAGSPWRREGRHCSSSSSAKVPGDSVRSETSPPQPGSSDPSQDALVTTTH